ncbi:MAG: hypothetical protein ABR986_08450 [Methanomassiliicoccales archaeon]
MLITVSIVMIGVVILMMYMADPGINGGSQGTPVVQQADQQGVSPDVSKSTQAPGTDLLGSLAPLFIAVPISMILILLAYRKSVRPRQGDPPQEPESYGEPSLREDD